MALLRLAPAQVFPQRRLKALVTAAGFLRGPVVFARTRHGGIIGRSCGLASLKPLPCANGGRYGSFRRAFDYRMRVILLP
jgi:hypothetical protein